MTSISVVDLSKLSLEQSNPSCSDFEEVSKTVSKCFEEIGFMYIINHGIAEKTITDAMEASMAFFKLEGNIKNKSRKGSEYQGWVEQGREIFDQDENGKIAELEIRETYDMKNASASGIFPDEDCPQLRKMLTNLTARSKMLTSRLLKCISLSLGLDLGFFDTNHQGMISQGMEDSVENCTTLRSIHYPPITDELAQHPSIIRCGEHADYGTITLLFQDSLGGLEVKGVDGKWINADPIPGAIVVNVGDLLESLSGGKYPATRHRVVVPELEFRRKNPRQSIAFFVHPDDDVVCQPLSGPDPKYPPVTARQHLENRFAATYGDRIE